MSDLKKPGRPPGKSRCECQAVGYLPVEETKRQFDALVASGRIGHYWLVEHQPDNDDKKLHTHWRLTPPPSRAVDWAKLCSSVQCMEPGESLPRKLVLGSRAVNDAGLDGLLYARHDKRYIDGIGEVKSHYDYPREAFYTDCDEWLDGLWAASDSYDPPPKRISVMDVTRMLEECEGMLSDRVLLRHCLVNSFTQGQYNMLVLYARELRLEAKRKPIVSKPDGVESGQQELPF